MTVALEAPPGRVLRPNFTMEKGELADLLLKLTLSLVEPGSIAHIIHQGHWNFAGQRVVATGQTASSEPWARYDRVEDAVDASMRGETSSFFMPHPFRDGKDGRDGIGVSWGVTYDPRPS